MNNTISKGIITFNRALKYVVDNHISTRNSGTMKTSSLSKLNVENNNFKYTIPPKYKKAVSSVSRYKYMNPTILISARITPTKLYSNKSLLPPSLSSSFLE